MLYHQLTRLTGGEKKSHMRIKVQGCLLQASFIEIHQIFAKKKKKNKVGYLSNRKGNSPNVVVKINILLSIEDFGFSLGAWVTGMPL